ncbi:MAG: hypothetical protein E6G27_14205 [Actinobacteria bacterium]|nr:MAG: hypothetical protein E6G27_14205 [Actinomycetota bacterium]
MSRWARPRGRRSTTSTLPTEQVIGVTADASAEDMEGAVAAAENGVEGFEEYLEVKTVGLPARG